ncbi:MAG: helix-turn-helix domain-containing protein, partial [Oscillospiraceae bacterium]
MNWLQQMNASLAYIEQNLEKTVDIAAAARLCCCSALQFQRMFSLVASVPLSEYIRNRRLAKAAFALQNNRQKVIDVALLYGYESPTAFNRAFQKFHGATPSAARNSSIPLKAYPPISFQITIKGAIAMNYRIHQQESFRAIGLKLETTVENEQNLTDIPNFWEIARQNGNFARLEALLENHGASRSAPQGILGLCAMNGQGSKFHYYIAAAVPGPAPGGFTEITVPATTYAVFECTGPLPGSIQTLTGRIYGE